MEGDLDIIDIAITERTGVIPDNPTDGFTDFHQKSGEKKKEMSDVISTQAKDQTTLANTIRKRKQELVDIDNALKYIDKHAKFEGGDDPEKWDVGDYNDAITSYKLKAGVKELPDVVKLALDKSMPGPSGLQDLNLALAEKRAKETQQKLDAAALRHQEHNLNQTEVLMDIQADRETLNLFPEVAALTEDASTANDYMSVTMSSDDFKDNPLKALTDAHEAIALTNPLFDLVGSDVYLEAHGASSGKNAAPEYFINRVVTPSIQVVQAYAEFLQAYPPAASKTFKTDGAKEKYTAQRQKYMDGFFVEISKTLGIETHNEDGSLNRDAIITRTKIEAVAKKLKNLIGDAPLDDIRLVKYAQLIKENVDMVTRLGLAGEDIEIILDPTIQDMLEAIRTIKSGNYKGSKKDETSVLESLNNVGTQYADESEDEKWKHMQEQRYLLASLGGMR
jgi:hypothetical protein